MPNIHLTYGGSSAHRTIACPGWVKASENLPKRPAGPAAVEGSMYHEVMELCQEQGKEPKNFLGHVYEEDGVEREFTEDDLPLAEIAWKATNDILDKYEIDEMVIEPFVQHTPGLIGGSIDLLGLSEDHKTLMVLDYKFGKKKVPVENSPNLALYTISAQKDPETAGMFKGVEKVVFVIIQPQVKGVTFTWETDLKPFKPFEKEFIAATKSTDVNPGSHCQWCPAMAYCEAKRLNVMATNLLGARDLGELQAGADALLEIEDWIKSMRQEIYCQLVRGVPIKGWKIINKRATRKWVDEKKLETFLKKEKKLKATDTHVTKLLSPAQMEKVLKKKKVELDLSNHIKSESSGTTLADESNPAEAVIVSDVQGHLKEIMG